MTATEVESQKSVIAFLDFSIFYIQCVLCSSAPARREAEVLTDPACLLDWTGTGHVSQQTLGCCPPPRALNEECFGVFLSGQRCSRQGRAEEASVPAKQSSDGGADLLFMLARHSQARRPVNDAVRLFSSTLTGWG